MTALLQQWLAEQPATSTDSGHATPPDATAVPARRSDLLLGPWIQAGAFRQIDGSLARYLESLQPEVPTPLLLLAALLSQLEGRGHTCLPLDALPGQADASLDSLLAWPQALWQDFQDSLCGPGGWWSQQGQPSGQDGWPCMATWEAWMAQARWIRRAGPGGDPDLGQPVVLEQGRLYLRRYADQEATVARHLLARMSPGTAPMPGRLDDTALRRHLASLFPAPAAAGDAPRFDWQAWACARALRSRLSVITGGPGTGKTYTAARLLALLFLDSPQPQTLRIGLAAPTGKAAARLKQSIDLALGDLVPLLAGELPLDSLIARMDAARTLHSLLGAQPGTRQFRHHAGRPLDVDVLLVDEASMVHLEMMAHLLEALPPHARLVLLGDKDQLASVEAGAVLGDLCHHAQAGRFDARRQEEAGRWLGQPLPAAFCATSPEPPLLAQHTVMLRESRRFQGPIGALALAVNQGRLTPAWEVLQAPGTDLAWRESPDPAPAIEWAIHGRDGASGYGACAALVNELSGHWPVSEPGHADERDACVARHAQAVRGVLAAFERCRVLCAVREGPWGAAGLNQAIQQRLRQLGLLASSGEWYAGRPVMVTRNDASLGVFNGDIGMVLPAPFTGQAGRIRLRAYFQDGPELRSVGVSRLHEVETAFAMTVHKSQGSEFAHTVLVLPERAGPLLSRELVYTGITRAKTHFSMVMPRAALLGSALGQVTRRASGLLHRLAQTPATHDATRDAMPVSPGLPSAGT